MKSFTVSLLALLLCLSCYASRAPQYPQYESVVKKFFTLYAPEEVYSDYNIRFPKMPDGWHVIVSDYDTVKKAFYTKKDLLFWSVKRDKFFELELRKAEKGNEESKVENELLQDWIEVFHFNTTPFYGYQGWEKDVINYVKTAANPNDTLLYSLAKAYWTYADDFVNLRSRTTDKYIKNYHVTRADIDSFIIYANKMVAADASLEKTNPTFNTVVGHPFTQRSNDYTDAYMRLMMLGYPEDAKKFIPPGLYYPAVIDMAKDYLASCATNAVLFTQGDNDTYPLLYVQEALNYRPDVHVINLSLLGGDDWIQYYLSSDTSLGAIPKILYEDNHDDWLTFDTKNVEFGKPGVHHSDTMNVTPFFDLLFDQNRDGKIDSNDVKDPKINAHYITLPVERNLALSMVEKDDARNIKNKIIFHIRKTYLQKPEWIMMHIMAHCIATRPIYFAYSVSPSTFVGLNNYLQQEGLAYRLVPVLNASSDGNPPVQKEIFYDNFMNHFSLSHLSDNKFEYGSSEYRMISNFHSITRLADALYADNRKDSALAVLNKLTDVIKDNAIPLSALAVEEVTLYYKLNKIDKAGALANKLLDMYSETVKKYSSLHGETLKEHQTDINEAIYVFNELQTQSEGKDATVNGKAASLFDKYKILYRTKWEQGQEEDGN